MQNRDTMPQLLLHGQRDLQEQGAQSLTLITRYSLREVERFTLPAPSRGGRCTQKAEATEDLLRSLTMVNYEAATPRV